jgi:hypothetical protein
MKLTLPLVVSAVVLGAPVAAHAQYRQAAQFHFDVGRSASLQQQEELDANGKMSTSGFFLGVIGMLGGAAIGSGIGSAQCGEDCVSRAAFGGASIAGAIMVPVGVHIAAEKPRNLLVSMGFSALAGAALWYGLNSVPGRPVALAPFVAAPLQVWTAMKVENQGR